MFATIFTYFKNLGIALDQLFNVLILNGSPYQTMSVNAADEQVKKKVWACWFCNILSVLVQKNHCQKQIDNVPMAEENYFRAAILLFGLAFILEFLLFKIISVI